MTTVLDRGTAPATHLLIVGVGAYRHLTGGAGPLLPDSKGFGALRQLTAPPLSARALARWFLDKHRNPEAPLGSVEMLSSPPQSIAIPGGGEIAVEPATMSNIESAFNAWYDRCNKLPGDVGILYFCGHGVEKGNLALLAEDFGANPNRLWANAVDFENTHRGVFDRKAKLQLFIADACRQVPLHVVNSLDFQPAALGNPKYTGPAPEDAPRLYATGPDELAWGVPNATTLFTEALVRTLDGMGSRRRERGSPEWIVTTGAMVEATTKVLERFSTSRRRNGRPLIQQCRSGGEGSGKTIVHRSMDPPLVPVDVGCRPLVADDQAAFALMSKGVKAYGRPPTPGRWKCEVRAAVYDVVAEFPSGTFRNAQGEIWVQPPDVVEVELEVGP